MPASSREQVVNDAIAWAHLHGLVVGQGDGETDRSIIHAPFALHPTPFPSAEFELVQRSMPLLSSLVQAVSCDRQYLDTVLARAAQFDEFTKSLLQVWRDSAEQRAKFGSQVVLGLHRSDYMLDEPSTSLLQVELNTIASSFGSLSTRVSEMHRYLLTLHPSFAEAKVDQLPEQNALEGFASAIALAHTENCTAQGWGADSEAAVVMVVQPGERNAFDQQWLQVTLWSLHGVRVLRKTLHQIATESEQDAQGTLWMDSQPVSVFYLRAGYSPDDYKSESEWQARRLMEGSNAVSCPSAAYQLVGAKKVQQDLAGPGQLERFVQSAEHIQTLRACFAGLWGLDDTNEEATAQVIREAIEDPDKFILKPQREGGGNNLYGQELVQMLQQGGEKLASYILMQRIRPPVRRSVLVRKGVATEDDCVTELGIYGAYVQVGDEVKMNTCCGHLLRTKSVTSNEGGVAAGFAVIDSPYLS